MNFISDLDKEEQLGRLMIGSINLEGSPILLKNIIELFSSPGIC